MPKRVYCCYCGKPIVYPLNITTEHIIPISKGGSNNPKNKRKCCNKCNTWRGNKGLDYWKWEVQWYIDNVGRFDGYSLYDMEIILINIDYIEQAVKTATPDMYEPYIRKRIFKNNY